MKKPNTIKMKSIFLFLLLIVCIQFSLTAQMMINEGDYLEDEFSKPITYENFVEKMDSGKYTLVPITKEDQKGYRLKKRTNESSNQNDITDGGDTKMMKGNIPFRDIGLNEVIDVKLIHHNHLLVKVKLESNQLNTETVWMIFDTGTYIPIIITDAELRESLGAIKSVYLNNFRIDSIANGSISGTDKINQMMGRYETDLGDKLEGYPIVGIMGFNLLSKLLVSIDIPHQRLVLRNIAKSEDKLETTKSIVSTTYKSAISNNIWIPVMMNGVSGYAHLDTGYSYNWSEESIFQKDKITTFKINDIDLLKGKNLDFKPLLQKENYRTIPFTLLANIGNEFLLEYVITIDAVNQKVFFEY